MRGNLYIISSPSGGGKGTLIREVLRTVPNIGYSVSLTTRAPREGEIHGQNYFFVTPQEFAVAIEQNELLEFAEVHGNFYGTSVSQVEKEISAGRDVILEIDVQGAANIRQILPDAVSIFILPPSYQILRERLILRSTESESNLALRLKNAHFEVGQYQNFDYIVVNDLLTVAVTELQAIILAERLRVKRRERNVQEILETFENL